MLKIRNIKNVSVIGVIKIIIRNNRCCTYISIITCLNILSKLTVYIIMELLHALGIFTIKHFTENRQRYSNWYEKGLVGMSIVHFGYIIIVICIKSMYLTFPSINVMIVIIFSTKMIKCCFIIKVTVKSIILIHGELLKFPH